MGSALVSRKSHDGSGPTPHANRIYPGPALAGHGLDVEISIASMVFGSARGVAAAGQTVVLVRMSSRDQSSALLSSALLHAHQDALALPVPSTRLNELNLPKLR
jgi:hypothetical protein